MGAAEASTPSGVPVFNVALPVLRRAGLRFRIWEARVPGAVEALPSEQETDRRANAL